jgi:dihydropyrimidinase
MHITGWPVTVINRGQIVIKDNTLQVPKGNGEFIPRLRPAPLNQTRKSPERAGFLKSLKHKHIK